MNVVDFLSLRISSDTPMQPVSDSPAEDAARLYFRSAAIETAVGYIASTLSGCEIKVYEGDAEKRDGELYNRLNIRPNPVQNASQLKERFFRNLLYNGDALMVVNRGDLYAADSFGVERIGIGRTRYTSTVVDGFDAGDFSPDNSFYMTYGNGRTRAIADGMADMYNKLLSAAAESYRINTGTKWKLKFDAPAMGTREFQERDQAERQDPKSALKQFMAGANAVYQETRGQSLEKIDTSGASADDVLKIRKEEFEAVANLYRVPVPMIFGNMTNLKENVDSFLTFAVKPIARQFEQEATGSFLESTDWSKGSRIVMDTSRIKNTSIFDIASSISQLIGAGFSLDEVRGQLDWPLINTEQSQEHLITRNYAPLDEMLRQLAQRGEVNE